MKPEISITCPRCNNPISKHDMAYANLLPNEGGYSFFHQHCYQAIDKEKQARYLDEYQERRRANRGTE